jgi:hypothetical protein
VSKAVAKITYTRINVSIISIKNAWVYFADESMSTTTYSGIVAFVSVAVGRGKTIIRARVAKMDPIN